MPVTGVFYHTDATYVMEFSMPPVTTISYVHAVII